MEYRKGTLLGMLQTSIKKVSQKSRTYTVFILYQSYNLIAVKTSREEIQLFSFRIRLTLFGIRSWPYISDYTSFNLHIMEIVLKTNLCSIWNMSL